MMLTRSAVNRMIKDNDKNIDELLSRLDSIVNATKQSIPSEEADELLRRIYCLKFVNLQLIKACLTQSGNMIDVSLEEEIIPLKKNNSK